MPEIEPNPQQILALVLGASSFRRAPKLAQGRAFYNSARDFYEYLTGSEGLRLAGENVNWLFDDSRSPSDQLQDIRDFLESRFTALKNEELQPQDLILYYVGHGFFSGADHTYCLAIRATDERNEGFTSIRASDLASIIRGSARFVRKFLILDCCFSAAAYKEFQSGPLTAGRTKLLDELPQRGTTLLCSASAQDPSLAPEGLSRTMFSDSLLRALRQGHPFLGPRLSLSELGDLVKTNIREAYPNNWVRPEVHSPDQREGDVASVALFPNAAYLAQKAAEEARQKAEAQRMREETEARKRAEAERIAQEAEEARRQAEALRISEQAETPREQGHSKDAQGEERQQGPAHAQLPDENRRKYAYLVFAGIMLLCLMLILAGVRSPASDQSSSSGVTSQVPSSQPTLTASQTPLSAADMCKMGENYYHGRGVSQDYQQAYEWFQKAADAGNSTAMMALGFLYSRGQGVPQDDQQAFFWYRKAADEDVGNSTATVSVASFYQDGKGVPRDYRQARLWYQKAADTGNSDGMTGLGFLYHQGLGVSRDYRQARFWYQKAADAGNSAAMYLLAVLYQDGKGVPRNYREARAWYQKSADAGYEKAKKWLREHPE